MSEKKEDEVSVAAESPMAKNEGLVAMLLSFFKKLTPGQELTTQALAIPDGFQSTDSSLERFQSGYLCHSDLLLKLNDIDDPVYRLVQILKWYFSAGQMLTGAIKKPLNPVLGEVSICKYYSNQSKEANKNNGKTRDTDDKDAFYGLSEMICHHPPVSGYMMENKQRGIRMDGFSKASIKFIGTAIKINFDATSHVHVAKFNETYTYTPPQIILKLVGLVVEYTGKMEITCSNHPYVARITFKEKPLLRGKYYRVKGTIVRPNEKEKNGEEVVMKFKGHWTEQVTFEDLRTKQTHTYVAADYPLTIGTPTWPALEDELPNSSRKVWHGVKTAVDSSTAAKAKREVEEEQRHKAKERQEKGEEHQPKHFVAEKLGDGVVWNPNYDSLNAVAF